MVSVLVRYLVIVATFCYVAKTTYAIKCYKCESFNNHKCGNKFHIDEDDEEFVVDCDKRSPPSNLKDPPENAAACMKMTIEVVYGQRQFLRDCYFADAKDPVTACKTNVTLPFLKEVFCHPCIGDLCNSSNIVQPIGTAIVLFFALARLLL